MEAFLSGLMDENAILDDLMDEYYMFDCEGTYVFPSSHPFYMS